MGTANAAPPPATAHLTTLGPRLSPALRAHFQMVPRKRKQTDDEPHAVDSSAWSK